jgi:hypothetical protein
MAFDALYQDRRDLTVRPLRDRRARLEDAVVGSELVFPVRRFASDGLEAWAQVLERTPEGYPDLPRRDLARAAVRVRARTSAAGRGCRSRRRGRG